MKWAQPKEWGDQAEGKENSLVGRKAVSVFNSLEALGAPRWL